MKFTLLYVQFIFIGIGLFAQSGTFKQITNGTKVSITGVIADSITNKGLAGATIELTYENPGATAINSISYVKRNAIATDGGKFGIENLPYAKKYSIVIAAVGYETTFKEIFLSVQPPEDTKTVIKNLGIIKLHRENKMLANVTVRATATPSMQFDVDRKIFNVEKNITAQGGTAVDVMKNIPSLSVDVEGNVQMRNSTPQILIDGRPTILTLDQIPADDIERVELITNPSAKFEAQSAGGIINIIMKKNKRAGLNGIASAGGGVPDLINGNVNLNLRQKKFNLFASGNYNKSGGVAREETFRINKSNDTITDYFNQSSENERSRKFSSVRFGADYFLDNNNTLSFTQSFNNGNFNNHEIQNQQYLDSLGSLNYTGLRTTNGTGTFARSSSRLSFERRFDDPENKLTADITYNKGSRSNQSFVINDFYNADSTIYMPSTKVRNDGSANDKQFIAQIDYSNKINKDKRIEFGLRTFYANSSSNFGTYSIDQVNNETKLPLSNDYKYTETINAGYFNYANKWKSLTYQLGLRIELSKFDGTLVDSNFHFGYKFPDGFNDLGYALFPSFFLTKPLSENQDIQFNYSKRIRRPRFWEVNPFVDINDPLNI
ncbi:MAG TPA: outer membrane beta-barrel protein, partial [Chitinophagaceae bacterium]